MIVSETSNRKTSRWVQVCVLLCAVVVLPLGVTYGQDYKAVAKRLDESVKKEEITQRQADVMMAALKNDVAEQKMNSNFQAIWDQLQAMVKSGKMTQEQAEAGMSAIKIKALAKAKTDAYLTKVWIKLQAEVKAGNMTAEDAKAKMIAIKKEKLGDGWKKPPSHEDIEVVENKIRAAVKAGKITKEQGRAKMAGLKARVYLMELKKELGAAVDAGKMSLEDAIKKYEAAEKEIKEKLAAERGEDKGKKRQK